MCKRLTIPDNFWELELNKDTKVRYYSPLGFGKNDNTIFRK